ncbi:MAG TPA: SDR family oxidoreductase [Thermoanaerobaculia bacterium]|jgi:uncharacterized protein YbjT (DUF2867 family)|nr:SDR family oxidoreductase [Thermoanaerobaculia bacterium]
MILITGATGKIGSELVRLLAERGEAVRALARHVGQGTDLAGVEWVSADLARKEGLAEAFAGAERLFLLTANSEDMVRLQKNAVAAAREAGVRHVVKLSALGASDHSKSVIGLWHYNVERVLKESGLAWTILRPHHFMDNLLDMRETIVREGAVHSAAGEGRIPFIDTRDIAAAAVPTLTESGHEGKVYTLTGPQAISYRDATEILSQVLGRPLSYLSETEDETWKRQRRAGEPPWRIAAQLALASYQRAGGATEQITATVEELTGRPARTVEQFARDHAAAFHN